MSSAVETNMNRFTTLPKDPNNILSEQEDNRSLRTQIIRPSRLCEEFDVDKESAPKDVTDALALAGRKRKATSPPPIERHTYPAAAFPSLRIDETPAEREERESLARDRKIREEGEQDDGFAASWTDLLADSPGRDIALAFMIRARRAYRQGATRFVDHFRNELADILSHPYTDDEPSFERKYKTLIVVWRQMANDVFKEDPNLHNGPVCAVEIHLKAQFTKRANAYSHGSTSSYYDPTTMYKAPGPIFVRGFGMVSPDDAGLTKMSDPIPTPPFRHSAMVSIDEDLKKFALKQISVKYHGQGKLTFTFTPPELVTMIPGVRYRDYLPLGYDETKLVAPMYHQPSAGFPLGNIALDNSIWLEDAMDRQNRKDQAKKRSEDAWQNQFSCSAYRLQPPQHASTRVKQAHDKGLQKIRASVEDPIWDENADDLSWIHNPWPELQMDIWGKFNPWQK